MADEIIRDDENLTLADGDNAAGQSTTVEVGADGAVMLPAGVNFGNAEFAQSGSDLVVTAPDGTERLEVQATFYDSFALVKPVHAVFAFRRGTVIEEAGHRVLHWECVGATNARQDPDGSTGFFLPGEEGYKDVRGSGLFPDIPGQSRDPIYNTVLPEN